MNVEIHVQAVKYLFEYPVELLLSFLSHIIHNSNHYNEKQQIMFSFMLVLENSYCIDNLTHGTGLILLFRQF